jgi:hypothetical protein
MRSFVAFVAGAFTFLVITVGGTLLLRVIFPADFDSQGLIIGSRALGASIFVDCLAIAAAIFVCARIAPRGRVGAIWGLALLVSCLVTGTIVGFWHTSPVWWNATVLCLLIPCLLSGAVFAGRDVRGRQRGNPNSDSDNLTA